MKDHHRRSTCRRCGRHKRAVGRISQAGNCLECATELLTDNMTSIHEQTGTPWERRRAGMFRYLLETPGVGTPPPSGEIT